MKKLKNHFFWPITRATFGLFCIILGGAQNSSAGDFNDSSIVNFRSSLPLIHLSTENLKKITKTETPAKISVLFQSINSSEALLREMPQYTCTVKIRGHSSAHFAKKQYDLKFHDPSDSKKKKSVPLLGLPAHHRWVLSANYIDRLLFRNFIAFTLARNLLGADGKEWFAPRTIPVELFVNKEYRGVYFLTEKIDGSKNKLALGKLDYSSPENSPFLLKVEKADTKDQSQFFKTPLKTTASYYEPSAADLAEIYTKDQSQGDRFYSHIKNKITAMEESFSAIKNGDPSSYRKIIDSKSFQNYILIQEITKNLDGYRRSLFIHFKDGLMHMGPIWDFDLALGNFRLFQQKKYSGFQVAQKRHKFLAPEVFWFGALLLEPGFKSEFIENYRTLRKNGGPLDTNKILESIDQVSASIMEAQERNFKVWPVNLKITDGPLSFMVPKYKNFDYQTQVTVMKQWLEKRLYWLDENIGEIGIPQP